MSLDVAIGMSNLPSVTVTSFLGALGVSGLTAIVPENVPETRVAVRLVMVMTGVEVLYLAEWLGSRMTLSVR
jgi:hypothetical protein